MTGEEVKIANSLLRCSFLPGSYDKLFVNQLPNWGERLMTESGRRKMIELFHKYRKQINGYKTLCETLEILNLNEDHTK